ncbi:MAG: thiaminase II [Lachnospiraceae bacterium]|nr:thiaminase II [Lachnospiraceae bacterium]
MKLSDILVNNVNDLWEEALGKDFVVRMALGTLERERFCNYMLQDYLYLLDYTDILKSTKEYSRSTELTEFLNKIIEETGNELYRVHIPNMKELGITEEDISEAVMEPVIAEYVGYMREVLYKYGLFAGLTALLQCSYIYAFIGENISEKYSDRIADSPYKSWFDAYTCSEYIKTNEMWADLLDNLSVGLSEEDISNLCSIFVKCAGYENKFWEIL